MLHANAYQCNENPAYKAEQNRFAAAFYKAYKVGVKANGCHCHCNHKFAYRRKLGKYRQAFTGKGVKNCRYYKVNNEHGEDGGNFNIGSRIFGFGCYVGKPEADRYNCKRSG